MNCLVNCRAAILCLGIYEYTNFSLRHCFSAIALLGTSFVRAYNEASEPVLNTPIITESRVNTGLAVSIKNSSVRFSGKAEPGANILVKINNRRDFLELLLRT